VTAARLPLELLPAAAASHGERLIDDRDARVIAAAVLRGLRLTARIPSVSVKNAVEPVCTPASTA
jgi:hypothetical protein